MGSARRIGTATAALLTIALSASALSADGQPRLAASGESAGAPAEETPALRETAPLSGLDAWICGAALDDATPPRSASGFTPHAADPATPWAAKLEIIEERFEDGAMTVSNCSAAAVAPRWLVTAAHCVGQEGWVSVKATLGARDSTEPSALRRTASVALCHERFDPRNLAFDVALLRLDEPLPPTFPLLRLATRAETARLAPGDPALSAGWGRISSSEISRIMRKATVRVVDPARRGDGMIVAAPVRHEESLCVGESGAPLVADLGGGPALFGVFSSVDAYYSRESGKMIELCHGFEARSYFTALRGLEGWIRNAIDACERDPALCAPTGADRPEHTER